MFTKTFDPELLTDIETAFHYAEFYASSFGSLDYAVEEKFERAALSGKTTKMSLNPEEVRSIIKAVTTYCEDNRVSHGLSVLRREAIAYMRRERVGEKIAYSL